MKITSERHAVTERVNKIEFDYKDGNGGYSFDAKADDPTVPDFNPEFYEIQKENYEKCLTDPDYSGPHYRTQAYTYTENAKGICECGEEIELYDQYMGASECPFCGKWHNLFGQQLINPQYWESESEY